MSDDLAALVRDATPEARANLRAALDAAEFGEGQLTREQLKGMTHEQVLEAHGAGRLDQLTGRHPVDVARQARQERRAR